MVVGGCSGPRPFLRRQEPGERGGREGEGLKGGTPGWQIRPELGLQPLGAAKP